VTQFDISPTNVVSRSVNDGGVTISLGDLNHTDGHLFTYGGNDAVVSSMRLRSGAASWLSSLKQPSNWLILWLHVVLLPGHSIFFCPYNERGDWVQGAATLGCPRVLIFRTDSTSKALS